MVHTTDPQMLPPFPDPASSSHDNRPSTSPDLSHSSSSSESASESDRPSSRRSRMDRPRLGGRVKSSSIIVPKDATLQKDKPDYPPDDARAMSPRRNSEDLEKLGKEMRQALKDQALTLQSSLAALAERIDEVRSDHDKLESENRFLQDYIGGLTRTMSKEHVASTSGKGKKK